eukprot:c1192_g1_i1.p1 GENE.c1192_g1_i1~~c1192_g1_i1.p1  ORF type:complete len:536 (+),score=134.38 c1192_g1_i1:168-1775(+)
MQLRTFVIIGTFGIFIPFFLIMYVTLVDPSRPVSGSDPNQPLTTIQSTSSSTSFPAGEVERLKDENARLRNRVDEMEHTATSRPGLVKDSSSQLEKTWAELENMKRLAEEKGRQVAELKKKILQQSESGGKEKAVVLSSSQSLLLDEVPFFDPADLQAESMRSLAPYALYRTPTEDWVRRAQDIIDTNQAALKNALHHVEDPGQRVTIVTALLDLGRDKLKDVGQFKRSFNEYIQRFQRTININFPMIVFIDAVHVGELDLSQHTKGVIVIPFTVKDLEAHFPGYFDRIEEIRNTDLYKRQAKRTGWLQFAPQAALKDYNLLVMSKIFFLRWASQLNPWRTQYHMFVDAGHDCVGALRTSHLNVLRKLMGRMMVTYFDYHTPLTSETHGMPQMAYRSYVGPPHNDPATWDRDNNCCKVVRGGIFGGTPAYIDVYARVYNVLLSQTLSDGYMGTEENVMGALIYRFPSLFNAYHNHDGDNCRLFVDAGEKPEADKSIFVHGEVPDHWDSESRSFVTERGSYKPLIQDSKRLRGAAQ